MLHKADELLRDAIDMHCHCYPEISLANMARLDDLEIARHCEQMGMRGVVLKSHAWPTTRSVHYLRQIVPNVTLFGSITLNICVGGIAPWVVEMAAKEGARVVWMPTWSTRSYLRRRGLAFQYMCELVPSLGRLSESEALDVLDADGRLLTNVVEVLHAVKELDLALFTGHLTPKETMAVVEEGHRIGLRKLVIGHPHGMGFTEEQLSRAVELGAYVELSGLGTMPLFQSVHPKQFFATMRTVGADHCILTTDTYASWCPPPGEGLRMLICAMQNLGATDWEVATMVRDNPAYLLGLAEDCPMPLAGHHQQ